jgi:hypothetical protein
MILVIRSTDVDQYTSAKAASAVNDLRICRDRPEQIAAQWGIGLRAQMPQDCALGFAADVMHD